MTQMVRTPANIDTAQWVIVLREAKQTAERAVQEKEGSVDAKTQRQNVDAHRDRSLDKLVVTQ